MHPTFLVQNTIIVLILWVLSLALFYLIIKAAVRNGVLQANERLIESVRQIEKSVHGINESK